MTFEGTSRRSFLIGSGAAATAAWAAPSIVSAPAAAAATQAPGPESILNFPAGQAPIDHVVVVMMENRSFDHWLGWLADDAGYLSAGQTRYGPGFTVAGQQLQTFPSTGGPVDTRHVPDLAGVTDPFRGCGFGDPGHSWNAGRAQRDGGFLASGSGNDIFATGYYLGDDLPFTSQLARRFTVCDHSHAALLGPTYPNREYLIAGQSYGNKTNAFPPAGGFTGDTVVEKMAAVGATVRGYYTDLPVLGLWGSRMAPILHPIADFFTDCAAGTLPNVSFVDPGFVGGSRTDNHPHGDVRAGERFVRDVFAAFISSPNYASGVAILTYDEWGGFFDHVAPPVFPDDRASIVDADNFGQAGFRVPTLLVSPYAQRGFVDHRTYDHTSIPRFLAWRFGGAPPEGTGGGSSWNLTLRDRNALNIGASLVMTADPSPDIDLAVTIDPPSADCAPGAPAPDGAVVPAAPEGDKHSFEELRDSGYFDALGFDTTPSPMAQAWVAG